MRNRFIRISSLLILLIAMSFNAWAQERGVTGVTGTGAQRGGGGGRGGGAPMAVTSSSWSDGGQVPAKNAGAMGASPALSWTNTPAGTVSFVLMMRDPDVARNRTSEDVLHWLMFNIPDDKLQLQEGIPAGATLPDGSMQVKNVAGVNGYRGPGAPASGPVHHYTLELYALDTKLGLTPDATRSDVMNAMQGHVLGKAVYVGLYRQPAQ